MEKDMQKLLESRDLIYKLANGTDPINGTPINQESFLHNPKVIRSLFYLVDFLDSEVKMTSPPRPTSFRISEEQKQKVKLPEGNIGVNDFSKAINEVIDPTISKKVNAAMINRKLKEMGILSESTDSEGKTRSITNDRSEGYGIISEVRYFNNVKFNQVLFNGIGKEFLLTNIEKIVNYEKNGLKKSPNS